jgi:hypothetical protein
MMFSKHGLRMAATVGVLAAIALGLSGVHASESGAIGAPPNTVLPTSLASGVGCGPIFSSVKTRVAFTIPAGSGTFTVTTSLPNGGFAPIPVTATVEQDLPAKTFRVTNATFDSKTAYVVDVIGDNGTQFPQWQTLPTTGVGTPLLDVSALGNFTAFSLCLWPADRKLTLTSSLDAGSGVFGYHFTCTQGYMTADTFTSFDFAVPTSAATPSVVTVDIPGGNECQVHTSSVPSGYVSDSDKVLGRFDIRGLDTSHAEMHNKKGTFDLEVQTEVHKVLDGTTVHYDFAVTVRNLGTVDFVHTGAIDQQREAFEVNITHPSPLVNSYPFFAPPRLQRIGSTVLEDNGAGSHTWFIPSIAGGQSYKFTTGAEPLDLSYVPKNTEVCATIPTTGFLFQPVELNTANNTSCVSVLP